MSLEKDVHAVVWVPSEPFRELQRLRARRLRLAADGVELARRAEELGRRVRAHFNQLVRQW